MKFYIASDHAGFERKQAVLQFIKTRFPVWEIHDEGPFSTDSVDYPDFANKVCHHFKEQHSHLSQLQKVGVLICGSGQGMCMRANKYANVRAALCWNEESARLSRQHNDANILCLGARLLDEPHSMKIIETFLTTEFEGGRHSKRVVKLSEQTT
jgi:ribose 5-phosphate isomerase B